MIWWEYLLIFLRGDNKSLQIHHKVSITKPLIQISIKYTIQTLYAKPDFRALAISSIASILMTWTTYNGVFTKLAKRIARAVASPSSCNYPRHCKEHHLVSYSKNEIAMSNQRTNIHNQCEDIVGLKEQKYDK